MSLIPAFEIGVWNAWIFTAYVWLAICLAPLFNRSTGNPSGPEYTNKREKIVFISYHIIFFVQSIYSIFLPFQLGTAWFYTGLVIALLGLVLYTSGVAGFATTPLGEEPITRGAYRFSRHPLYVSMAIVYIGVGIACASWLMILLSIAFTVLSLIYAVTEEQGLLKQYGDKYRRYMDITPRWLGIPKSW